MKQHLHRLAVASTVLAMATFGCETDGTESSPSDDTVGEQNPARDVDPAEDEPGEEAEEVVEAELDGSDAAEDEPTS